MDCKSLQSFVGAYVDGEFDERDKADVDAHLAGCPTCLRLVHDEARFRAKVRSTLPISAPAGLRDRIVARLGHEPPPGATRGRWVVVTTSATATLVALLAMAAWLILREERMRLSEEAALRHARGLPLEVSAVDIQQVRLWFSGKLDFHASFPVFVGVAPLLGARLSHLRDKQAAYLAYQGGHGGRLSLFVFDDPDWEPDGAPHALATGRQVYLASSHGYRVVSWTSSGIAYSLVGDLDESEILALIERAEER